MKHAWIVTACSMLRRQHHKKIARYKNPPPASTHACRRLNWWTPEWWSTSAEPAGRSPIHHSVETTANQYRYLLNESCTESSPFFYNRKTLLMHKSRNFVTFISTLLPCSTLFVLKYCIKLHGMVYVTQFWSSNLNSSTLLLAFSSCISWCLSSYRITIHYSHCH